MGAVDGDDPVVPALVGQTFKGSHLGRLLVV